MHSAAIWLALLIITLAVLVIFPRQASLADQAAVIGIASIVLLMFSFTDGSAEYDSGGDPAIVMTSIIAAQRRGEEVAIRGVCLSSCALKLSAGNNLCVSPSAEIGVHEVRRAYSAQGYWAGVRDELWTGYFAGMLPGCARDLFNAQQGFGGGRLAMVSGRDILRACPTIRACAER